MPSDRPQPEGLTLRLPLLARLRAPAKEAIPSQRRVLHADQREKMYRAAVRDELARLLKTRRVPMREGSIREDMKCCVLNYGIPEPSSLRTARTVDDRTLEVAVRESIECFETRLKDVQVSATSTSNAIERRGLRIEAQYRSPSYLGHTSWDARLDWESGCLELEGPTGGPPA